MATRSVPHYLAVKNREVCSSRFRFANFVFSLPSHVCQVFVEIPHNCINLGVDGRSWFFFFFLDCGNSFHLHTFKVLAAFRSGDQQFRVIVSKVICVVGPDSDEKAIDQFDVARKKHFSLLGKAMIDWTEYLSSLHHYLPVKENNTKGFQ